jgi:hypothetical protein
MNRPAPRQMINPKQTNVFTPEMYRIAKSIKSASSPPPRYQMYCAFSPRNSMGLLMPLLMLYTLMLTGCKIVRQQADLMEVCGREVEHIENPGLELPVSKSIAFGIIDLV